MKNTLVPLFIVCPARGPVWLPSGGDGDGDGAASTEGTGETFEDADASTEGDDAVTTTVDPAKYAKLEADYAALRNQLSASDRNKAKALADLEEVKRKERSELENAQADAKRLEGEATGWQEKFRTLAIQNAFLAGSMEQKIQWHSPALALKAADLSTLAINPDDGSVDGMKELIKKVAAENPFLVTSTTGTTTTAASGSNVGNGKTTNKGKPGTLTQEELQKRFPALK